MTEPKEAVDDEALVLRFRETGEVAWLDELFGRHMDRIRRLIFPIVLDADAADDLAQEACIRATRSILSFRGDAAVATWLNRIAINTALAFLRCRRRAPAMSGDEDLSRQPSRGAGPCDEVMGGEMDRAVHRAMADLPGDLRAAISLTALQGLSPAEAAKQSGCLTATMYWRVHQARKLLRKALRAHLT